LAKVNWFAKLQKTAAARHLANNHTRLARASGQLGSGLIIDKMKNQTFSFTV